VWVIERPRGTFSGRWALIPDNEWVEQYRVDKKTFAVLVEMLRPYISTKNTNFR
jgi:hypothetical protein